VIKIPALCLQEGTFECLLYSGFVPSLFAQYATVSANLGDITGNNAPQSFLRFELYNCGYNFPEHAACL